MRIIMIDTETTGLVAGTHAPIEIAAVALDENLTVLREFEFFIDPYDVAWQKGAWEMNASRVLGRKNALGDERVAGYVYAKIQSWLFDMRKDGHQLHLAGCRPEFDRDMIARDPRTSLGSDAMDLCHYRSINLEGGLAPYWLLGKLEGCGLRHGRVFAGLEGEQSHTAMQDVRDCIKILRKQIDNVQAFLASQ